MDLSIIIVNWNTKNYLEQCLESVFEHAKGIEYEVFVIDNASTDGSVQVVKEKFPQIKLIENKENVGFARANNQAIKKAQGEFICLLNPDTLIIDSSIAKMLNFIKQHNEAGVVGAKLTDSNGKWDRGWGKFPTITSEIIPGSMHKIFLPKRNIEIGQNEHIDVDWVGGAALIFRSSIVQNGTLLDENFFMYSEETDFCYRVKNLGYKVYGLLNTKIVHFQNKSARQNVKSARVQMFKGKFKFFKKNKNYVQALIFKFLFILKTCLQIPINLLSILIRPAGYQSKFKDICLKLFLLKSALIEWW